MYQVMWITQDEPVAVFIPTTTTEELETLWVLPSFTPPTAPSAAPEFIPPQRTNRIRPDLKRAWCGALRSGRYRKIFGRYADDENGRCAMGVLFDVLGFNPEMNLESCGLGPRAYEKLASSVIGMNDDESKETSFAEIADYIEENW